MGRFVLWPRWGDVGSKAGPGGAGGVGGGHGLPSLGVLPTKPPGAQSGVAATGAGWLWGTRNSALDSVGGEGHVRAPARQPALPETVSVQHKQRRPGGGVAVVPFVF